LGGISVKGLTPERRNGNPAPRIAETPMGILNSVGLQNPGIDAFEVLYKEKTGREMDKYFRFPEGKYSESALKCIKNMGYKTMFWSFGYEDWDNNRQPSYDYAIKKILSNTHNGAIILLHPNSSTNAKILPELISAWRKMGYEFGTLHDFDNI
jgi:peptidoglycan-N-acetylmuramic acid deacetylase